MVCFYGKHLVQGSKLENWHDPYIEGSIQNEALETARRNPKIFYAVSKSNQGYFFLFNINSFNLSQQPPQQGLYLVLQLATM